MNPWLTQWINFLVVSPGNLVYHLILAFSVAAALVGALNHWFSAKSPGGKRRILGLGVLFLLQGIFLAAGALPENLAAYVLPPLDRAITLLSLIWVAWLWVFPEKTTLADAATLLLSFFVLVIFALSVVAWPQTQIAFLSHALINLIWQALSIAFTVIAILLLFLRKPAAWGLGVAFFLLALAGHVLTLVLGDQGIFPGIVRLAHLAMFPMLLTLNQGQSLQMPAAQTSVAATQVPTAPHPEPVKPVKEEKKAPEPAVPEKRRFSIDPKTLGALLNLAAESDPDRIGSALARAVAQAALADLSFLVFPEGEKHLAISCGFDLIREEKLGGAVIAGENVPQLINAVHRGKPLRLPASSTSVDLKGIGQALGLGNAGHLLSIPLVSQKRGPLGALLLLSPYSNRLWSAEDQSYLGNVASSFVPILERGQRIAALQVERDAASKKAAQAEAQAGELSTRMDELQEKEAQLEQKAGTLDALNTELIQAQQMIEHLRTELIARAEQPPAAAAANPQVEQELRMSLEEVAYLQNTLAEANIKILELEKRPEAPINTDQVEVIASLSQELRQPMSSIVGYTDLLLGESVGILGALQRKFIERIKASTERIGGLVDDLIQITTLEAAHVEIKPEPVDLNLIIDNAVAYTSTQIREKNITLQLDTPETSPRIQTDREALQQIIIHLLQNAGAATPAEGTIGLHMHIQEQEHKEYLQIAVTDSGGGISADDIERVFKRRYRADHTLIQGVGDTSVGLSITKSLVDAQNGRIWVDSKPGVGATFSVLLPVNRLITLDEG